MAGIRESELPSESAEMLRTGDVPGSPMEYKTVADDPGELTV